MYFTVCHGKTERLVSVVAPLFLLFLPLGSLSLFLSLVLSWNRNGSSSSSFLLSLARIAGHTFDTPVCPHCPLFCLCSPSLAITPDKWPDISFPSLLPSETSGCCFYQLAQISNRHDSFSLVAKSTPPPSSNRLFSIIKNRCCNGFRSLCVSCRTVKIDEASAVPCYTFIYIYIYFFFFPLSLFALEPHTHTDNRMDFYKVYKTDYKWRQEGKEE